MFVVIIYIVFEFDFFFFFSNHIDFCTPLPTITYYVSRERIRADKSKWITNQIVIKMFKFMLQNARTKADVFKLPAQDIVEVGYTVVI